MLSDPVAVDLSKKRHDGEDAYSFTMPAQPVTVKAYFTAIEQKDYAAYSDLMHPVYREAYGWKEFSQIVEFDATAIEGIQTGGADDESIDRIYDVNGIERQQLGRGINIVRMRNGKVKKVYVN